MNDEHYFKILIQIFEIFANIYKNQNFKINVCHKYNNFHIKIDNIFIFFHFLYWKHDNIIDKFEKNLRKKLKNKLFSRMRDKLIDFNLLFKIFNVLKIFC